jgi:hypothetical protein
VTCTRYGTVLHYEYLGGAWQKSDFESAAGTYAAIDGPGKTIVAGDPFYGDNNTGRVHVFSLESPSVEPGLNRLDVASSFAHSRDAVAPGNWTQVSTVTHAEDVKRLEFTLPTDRPGEDVFFMVDVASMIIPTVSSLLAGPESVRSKVHTFTIASTQLVELDIYHVDVHPASSAFITFSYDDGVVDQFVVRGNGGLQLYNPADQTWGGYYGLRWGLMNSYLDPGNWSSVFNALSSKQYYVANLGQNLENSQDNRWVFRNLENGLVSIELDHTAGGWTGFHNVNVYLLTPAPPRMLLEAVNPADGAAIGAAISRPLSVGRQALFKALGAVSSVPAQTAEFFGETADDYAGASVAISQNGLHMVYAEPRHDNDRAGRIRIKSRADLSSPWVETGAFEGIYDDYTRLGSGHYGAWQMSESDPSSEQAMQGVAISSDGKWVVALENGEKRDGDLKRSGIAHLYEFDGTEYQDRGEWAPNDKEDAKSDGCTIAMTVVGNVPILVMGLPYRNKVRVAKYNNGNYEMVMTVDHAGSAKFGNSVAISEDGLTLAVGDPEYSIPGAVDDENGCAIVFTRTTVDEAFTFDVRLDGLTGLADEADGDVNDNELGRYVALSGDGKTVALASTWPRIYPGGSNERRGAIMVYKKDDDYNWVTGLAAGVANIYGYEFKRLGHGVALSHDGNTLVTCTTYAYLLRYEYINDAWTQTWEEYAAGQYAALSADGSTTVVGRPHWFTSSDNDDHHGRVRVYDKPAASTPYVSCILELTAPCELQLNDVSVVRAQVSHTQSDVIWDQVPDAASGTYAIRYITAATRQGADETDTSDLIKTLERQIDVSAA